MSRPDRSALKYTLGLRYIRIQFEHGWWAMFVADLFSFLHSEATTTRDGRFFVVAEERLNNRCALKQAKQEALPPAAASAASAAAGEATTSRATAR